MEFDQLKRREFIAVVVADCGQAYGLITSACRLILVAEEMREEMIQTRLAISAAVLVLSAGVSVQTATACSEEAVADVVDRWTTVLAENNPDTIVALYSKDAVLWGTLSPTVRSDPAGQRESQSSGIPH